MNFGPKKYFHSYFHIGNSENLSLKYNFGQSLEMRYSGVSLYLIKLRIGDPTKSEKKAVRETYSCVIRFLAMINNTGQKGLHIARVHERQVSQPP